MWQIEFAEIGERNHFDVIADLAENDSWLARAARTQMAIEYFSAGPLS